MSEKQTYAELKKRVQQLEQERSELRSLKELLRKSHQIIEGILNAIPVRVFWKDRNLIYMGCNKLFARDAGFVDPEDIIGKDDYQMGWRDQAELYRKDDREVIESGDTKFLIEEPQTTPEGNTITLLTSKIPLCSATGEINGVLGTYIDITDHKREEEALRESKSSLRAITDSAQDAILMMDPEGRISYWNPAAERILGYMSAEAIGQNLHALIVPSRYHEAHDAAFPVFQQKGQGAAVGKTLNLEARRKDGKEISVQLSLSAVHMKGAWHAVGVLRDSTEHKRAEETLRKSEERFRTLADSTFEGIIIHDEGEILDVNQSFLQMIGYESDEVIGKNMFDFVAPGLRELVVRHVQTGSDEAIEIEVVRKDGTPLTMEAAGKTITHKDKPARVVALHNITERKRAEDALRNSEGKHKLLFDSAGDAIFIHDTKARILAVNPLATPTQS